MLLIDDDEETNAALLRVWGYEALAASTGSAGLARALWFQPHVVLTDLQLPGMDGYAVAKAFRMPPWDAERPLLIAHTGWGRAEDRQRAEEAGFGLFLLKPASLDELECVLAEIAGRPRAAQS